MPHTSAGAPSFFQGFKQNRGGRLVDLLNQEFRPELGRARDTRNQVTNAFLGFLDPRSGLDFITQGADRIASDVLRPGGDVAEAIRGVRGQAIQSGFGTQRGDLGRSEAEIVNQGLRSSVGSFIGQSLPALFEGTANRAANTFQFTEQQVRDLLESLFTGLGSAESLNLAGKGNGLLGLGLGPL